MAHLIADPKDISILKAYWINHGVDQSEQNEIFTQQKKSKRRQASVAVYGVDIHPDGTRFATCGADEKIKIWSMAPVLSPEIEVTECVDKLLCVCQYDKSKVPNAPKEMFHNAIHCVRFSHDGRYLASGSADGIVTIWRLDSEFDPSSSTHSPSRNLNHHQILPQSVKPKSTTNSNPATTTNHYASPCNVVQNVEHWVIVQHLSKHRDEANSSASALTTDVQDLCWAPDDSHLVSAGSDNNIIIWNKMASPTNEAVLECGQIIKAAHNDMILGLAFDPMGEFIHSQSADGTAKIWHRHHEHGHFVEYKSIDREFKKRSQFIERNTNDALSRLDVCQRGSWSPDGMHLLTSFGVTEDNIFISPMYKRRDRGFENELSLVGHSKPTTVSKWSPRIYCKLDNDGNECAPFFFVAAVGSMDRSLSVWKSNQSEPLMVFRDIGRESVLDIAWSRTGDILMASTHDGNVLVAVFGRDAFQGRQLGIDQHCDFVQRIHGGTLSHEVMHNVRTNITLVADCKFNQVAPQKKAPSVRSEDALIDVVTDGDARNQRNGTALIRDDAMLTGDAAQHWTPREDMFGPQEGIDANLEIGFQSVEFEAIDGKQQKQSVIPDFYGRHGLQGLDIENLKVNDSDSHSVNPSLPRHSDSVAGDDGDGGDGDGDGDGVKSADSAVHFVKTVSKRRKKRKRGDVTSLCQKEEESPSGNSSASGQEGDVEMEENEVPHRHRSRSRKSKKRKMDENGRAPSSSRRRRRKWSDKLIRIEVAERMDAEYRGSGRHLKVYSERIQRDEERVSVVHQEEVIGGRGSGGERRCRWRTEIPGEVSRITVNDQWTMVGTVGGELFCFGASGRLLLPPIQMEEGIVSLSMSPRHKLIGNRYREQQTVYVLIIAADCTLRVWRVDTVNVGGGAPPFDPDQVLKTNIWSLIRMTNQQCNTKDIALKHAMVTSHGKVLLTLSNDFMFTFKPTMDCWLRIADHKYWLSQQRQVDDVTMPMISDHRHHHHHRNGNGNAPHSHSSIDSAPLTLSDVLSTMNRSGTRTASNLDRTRNAESCRMHTISHLEQQLTSLTVIGSDSKNREEAFKDILTRYMLRLADSMTLSTLSFAVYKMEEICTILLAADGAATMPLWPGTLSTRREWLRSILHRIAANRNNSVKLHRLIARFQTLLNAALASNGRDDDDAL